MRRNVGLASLVAMLGTGCYAGADVGSSFADGSDAGSDTGGDTDGPEEELGPPDQPLHRLNRTEYDNTVADLTGTRLRPASAFPPDPKDAGFDNQYAALSLTPALLEQYYSAAGLVLDDALDPTPVLDLRLGRDDVEYGPGLAGTPVSGEWLQLKSASALLGFDVGVEEAGAGTIALTVGRVLNGISPEPTMDIRLDGEVLTSVTVKGSTVTPERIELAVQLDPGSHTLELDPLNFESDAVEGNANNILFLSLELLSDALEDGPGRALVYPCEPSEGPGCVEEIVGGFASRAWRRPATETEVEDLLGLYLSLRAGGEAIEPAMKLTLRAIMTSPKFLYRMRTSGDSDTPESLDGYVLASRLSYFLWSTMPDDILFEAAANGELQTLEGLLAQTERMLEDPKAHALVTGFGEQWLSVRAAETAAPDTELYPLFSPAVIDAMQEESRLLFDAFLFEELPAAQLLSPGFAFISPRLAAHYDAVPAPEGPAVDVFERLPAERSGVLSLGAWLIATADPDMPSPIRRGHWISDHVICNPVPPPPPGLEIPELEPPNEESSVRDQLEKHRSDPACAGCHTFLDVLGMGMQRYDAVARVDPDPLLDTVGELPGGIVFEGADELAQAIEPEEFVGCVSHKLFTYAVGRPPTSAEREELTALAGADSSLHALITGIVSTPAFRMPADTEGL